MQLFVFFVGGLRRLTFNLHVISALDDVAWLTNLRAGDVLYNPVFFSFALVTPSSATLYIRCAQLAKRFQRSFASLQPMLHCDAQGVAAAAACG